MTITPEKVEAEVENEYDISAVSISGCKVKKTEDGYSVTGDIKITYAIMRARRHHLSAEDGLMHMEISFRESCLLWK